MLGGNMRLGLIAGGGALPQYVSIAAKEAEIPLIVAALQPFADVADYEAAEALNIGQLGKAFKIFKKANCTHVCMDFKAFTKLPSIIRAAGQGDDALLRHMMGLFEDEGFEIISPQEICADLLLDEGVLGKVAFEKEHRDDALKACEIAREVGRLDIGQGAVVARGVTLAVEAQEGTDDMLARVRALPEHVRGTETQRCGVLAKLIKPTQDRRVDLPTLGPETIHRAAEAGLAGIVAEAGQAFILHRETVLALADETGLFIAGIPAQDDTADIAADKAKPHD